MNRDDVAQMMQDAAGADWGTEAHFQRFAALVIAAQRHPGYIMGEHWLQAAYTRICTNETEAEVMADYGWQRESR